MKRAVVILGMGEMGSLFARGFLKLGHPVAPVTRDEDPAVVAREFPDPALALVAVGEEDIHPLLARLPETWRPRLGLLQNELLPRDWRAHGIDRPTVIAVWFEKKAGQEHKVILPSPVHGPGAGLLAGALGRLCIPVGECRGEEDLTFELVRKNLYILTINIAGLVTGGTVSELWERHRPLAREVAEEILDLQSALVGGALDRERLIEGMVEGFVGDPSHKCMGRSAPTRLARAIAQAGAAGIAVPTLRRIAAGAGIPVGG